MDLARKIHERQAKVAVIGIGYVGLPLSIEIARAGYRTTGIDVDLKKDLSAYPSLRYLIKVAMVVLGLAPGLRDVLRVAMGI
jgi:UDP-N-acetyl-D-glucosamine dehydrogenase